MNQYLKIIIIVITIAILLGVGIFVYQKYLINNNDIISQKSVSKNNDLDSKPGEFTEPIADFTTRITKKPFGKYITPNDSPVQPERFSGYHTGVDIEYDDILTNVPVFALTDSKIEQVSYVSGYGGVVILSFNYNNKKTYAIYGHLRLSSVVQNNLVKKGEQFALLGTSYSPETDNERRHLHFGILKKNTVDLKGYVPALEELNSGWYNPLDIIK